MEWFSSWLRLYPPEGSAWTGVPVQKATAPFVWPGLGKRVKRKYKDIGSRWKMVKDGERWWKMVKVGKKVPSPQWSNAPLRWVCLKNMWDKNHSLMDENTIFQFVHFHMLGAEQFLDKPKLTYWKGSARVLKHQWYQDDNLSFYQEMRPGWKTWNNSQLPTSAIQGCYSLLETPSRAVWARNQHPCPDSRVRQWGSGCPVPSCCAPGPQLLIFDS